MPASLTTHIGARVDATQLEDFHDLRHCFGSAAAKVFPNLADVQAMLGHSHTTTTMRYVHHRPGAEDAQLLDRATADVDDPRRADDRTAAAA